MFHLSTLKKLSKTTLLSLIFLITVFGMVAPVFAVGEEKYRDLWGLYNPPAPDPVTLGTPEAVAGTQSGVFFKGADSASLGPNGVTKFYIGANLIFPGVTDATTKEFIEKNFWDYVANDGEDSNNTFVLRTYKLVNGQPFDITYNGRIFRSEYREAGTYSIPNGGGTVTVPGSVGIEQFYKQTDTLNETNNKYGVNQKIAIPLSTTTPIPYGTQMGADLWYCGGRGVGVGDGDFSGPNEPRATGFQNDIAFFTNPELCDGTAYWKIGPSITFTMPTSATDTTAGATTTAAGAQTGTGITQNSNVSDNLPQCSFGISSGSFLGCIAYLVYYAIYWPIAWIAGILGQLFDFFLGYSLSDASYRAQFAVRGWQIVRDLSNIFFIIILVYTGLMAVFSTTNNMKKVIPQLILNVLLINFSLFGTRVIIDISNVVARVFYKSVQVCDGPCAKDANGAITNAKEGIAGYTPLSEKIVSAFNPQKIFSTSTLNTAAATPAVGTNTAATNNLDRTTSEYAGYYIVVSLIAAFILFAIAMMFWKTAFFFIGRVIGLYIAMIFAPFAVLSRGGMPIVSNIEKLSWKKWSEDLISYAMLAPIFVFFLYVIYSFLETDFVKVYADKVGTSFFETIVYIAIPMIIVWKMIEQGVKIAEKYAGEFGKSVTGFVNKATGLVGGAALGGVGLVGGRLIGAAATRLNQSKAGEWLRDKGKGGGAGGWLARRSINTVNSAEKTSFDFRKTKAGQSLFKEMGINTDQKALSALSGMGLGLGTSSTAGGYQGQVERYQKKQEAEAKLLESKQSQGDIDAFNDKNKKDYQSKVDKIIEDAMNAAHGQATVANWKVNDKNRYEAERQNVMLSPTIQSTINAVEKPVEKKSVQEMNTERKDAFAENLKKTSLFDESLNGIMGGSVGMILGTNTRAAANKKAAKKISESTKIEKDLTEINDTLKGGFREIIAMDKLRNDPLWQNLGAAERTSLMRGEKITFTNSAGQQVEGGFYDYVKDKDPNKANVVDIDVTSAENDKDKKKDVLDQIKARQQFKFDFKTLNEDIKTAEYTYATTPNQANLDSLNQLKAERVRLKNEQKKWQDLDKYIDEQKKKLEGK